jgi:Undecaprenyl-phosphate glucose phosphotransferase
MSNVPRSQQVASSEADQDSAHSPQSAEREMSAGIWRALMRPLLIEKVVLVIDVILIIATSVICSVAYMSATTGSLANETAFVGIGVLVSVNFAAVMSARRNYSLKNLTLIDKQVRETIVVWSCVYGLLAVVGFAMKISSSFSRGSTILIFIAGLAMLLAWRVIIANFISMALSKGSFARKKIIIITEQNQSALSRPLSELQRYGYHAVQTCEISSKEMTALGIGGSLRAKLDDVVTLARSDQIEDIYLLVRWHHHRIIDGILDALAVLPVSIHLVPDENTARFLNHPIANIGGTWTTELRRAPLTRGELRAKRCFDLILASSALVFLLPMMLVTALFIKLDSRGPVFFQQKRNGFNDQAFNIFKFRTMHVLEDGAVVQQAIRNDPRVTRLGRWLRRSSIDELPQLFNVIRGEMSLVGPRPHAASHNSEYEKLIANYAFRHHVKPGLTGWAQINGWRGETRTIEQMERRVEHDLWYINNWSPLLDLRIILQTIVVALRQNKAF